MIRRVAQRLPRFYVAQQRIEDERKLAMILLETGGDEVPQLVNGADGHHWQRRRGLPLISRGVRGATAETDPVRALLAKEARDELRL